MLPFGKELDFLLSPGQTIIKTPYNISIFEADNHLSIAIVAFHSNCKICRLVQVLVYAVASRSIDTNYRFYVLSLIPFARYSSRSIDFVCA